jgi:hypothetical protein
MGISGAKSKLRKGGGRAEGWYKVLDAKWDERTSNSGTDYFVFAVQGEKPDGSEEEILLFLDKSDKVGEYARIDDGSLISVDKEDEFEIKENSGVGRFFGSLSDAGISDRVMDNIGDKPGGLKGKFLHFTQEAVLDKDGEPKKNDAGYDITNTIVDKVGTEKEFKAAGTGSSSGSSSKKGKAAAKGKPANGRRKKVVDEDEEDEEDEEEDDDDDDEDSDEDSDEEDNESDDEDDDDESDDDEDEDDDESDDDDEEDDDEEDEDDEPPTRRGRKPTAKVAKTKAKAKATSGKKR